MFLGANTVKPRKQPNNKDNKYTKSTSLDNFSYNLPTIDILSKSSLKNNKNKELDRINSDAALKLEKTLSEYGV